MRTEEKSKESHHSKQSDSTNDLTGYPLYPEKEDIYFKCREEKDIDPEDTSTHKVTPTEPNLNYIDDFKENESGNDLDIPGINPEDVTESSGIEDEENDYFSLGGDDHDDLEEDWLD